jgi:5-methylcytosine-specific restriction endonuclease McrA
MSEELSMEDTWKESLKETRAREASTRAWLEKEIYTSIRDLRSQHGTYLHIQVYVPWCAGCVYMESRALETDCISPPDITSSYWKAYYRDLGFSKKELGEIRRGMRDGWQPRCRQCGSRIDLDEGVYVRRIGLSEYFDLYVKSTGHIPSWMKKAVRDTFGTVCGECGGKAATLDHIVALSKGGLTEVVNLQPLCEACNTKKADQEVELTTIVLTFPLRPPPSDAFEGVIW